MYRALPLLALAGMLGCKGDTGGQTDDTGDPGDPDFATPHGLVQVKAWLQYDSIQLHGYFGDGPALDYHSEAQREGSCRLVTYTATTCEPACDPEEACIDAECVAWPQRQDMGDLEWVWPDGQQTVSPDDTTYSYWGSGSASSEGDTSVTFEGTTLTAPLIASAEPDGDWAEAIQDRGDADAVLRWSNPVDGARVRLHMTDCVGSHAGIAEAEIECEGADVGELVIPDAFLDVLTDGDWSHGECGAHSLFRYHYDNPAGDDTVRLESLGETGLFWRPDW